MIECQNCKYFETCPKVGHECGCTADCIAYTVKRTNFDNITASPEALADKDDYVVSKNGMHYNSELFKDLEDCATLPSPLMDEIMKAYEEDPEKFSISVNEYTAKLLGDVGILKEGEEYKSPYTVVTYDSCTDNRFDLVDHFKQKLIEGTNIEAYPDEMAVIDNILFRMWDLGWLDKLSDAGA